MSPLFFFLSIQRQTTNPEEVIALGDDESNSRDGDTNLPASGHGSSSPTKLARSQSLSSCLAKKNMHARMRAASDLIEQHKISHLNLKRLKEQHMLKNSIRKSSPNTPPYNQLSFCTNKCLLNLKICKKACQISFQVARISSRRSSWSACERGDASRTRTSKS